MWNRFKDDALRWVVPGQIADPTVLTWWVLLKLLYAHLPLRAMAWYRLACWSKQRHIPLLYGMLIRRIYLRHGLEIWGDIGGGLYIPHPIGTVIAVEAMGRNCSVISAVTIGMREKWGFPQIGDNVFIGTGARLLGTITVGDHAKIGANSVVLHDVPATVTVVGAPARVATSSKQESKQNHNGLLTSSISSDSLSSNSLLNGSPPNDFPPNRHLINRHLINGSLISEIIHPLCDGECDEKCDGEAPRQFATDACIGQYNSPK